MLPTRFWSLVILLSGRPVSQNDLLMATSLIISYQRSVSSKLFPFLLNIRLFSCSMIPALREAESGDFQGDFINKFCICFLLLG